MGLDVYVGTLSRYYLREWQIEVEQLMAAGRLRFPSLDGDEEDLQVFEVKSGDRSFAPRDWPEATRKVLRWREGYINGLGIEPEPDWPETQEARWFTRKITWECYLALLLWAAHDRYPLGLPASVPEKPDEDPALARCRADLQECRYPHLLGETEIWLPVQDGRTTRAFDPGGSKKTDYGSLHALSHELERLNESTWGADEDQVWSWWNGGPSAKGSPLEECAQFGFAVFEALCGVGLVENLPMVLDY